MTTILAGSKAVTFINTFTCQPAHQPRLVAMVTRTYAHIVRLQPGFIASSLHRGLDGTKVTVYAQWRSREDYQAVRSIPEVAAMLKEAAAFATFESHPYEVAETFAPAGSGKA